MYEYCRAARDIWAPPIKELHYFDRHPSYPSPSHLALGSPLQALGRDRIGVDWRRRTAADVRRVRMLATRDDVRFWRRYWLRRRADLGWYRRLFTSELPSGDFTPAYSLLTADDIATVGRAVPHGPYVYVLRDPVERTWSGLRHELARTGADIDRWSASDIVGHLAASSHLLRSRYLAHLRRWREVVGSERMVVLYFDDIVDRPEVVIDQFRQAVGLPPRSDDVGPGPVNAAPSREMPAVVRDYLVTELAEELEGLSDELGGHPDRWRRRHEGDC